MHEAATANNPLSGTFYDPNNSGDVTRLASQGVHEHWNNPTDMLYSRNLGIGDGIELIYINDDIDNDSISNNDDNCPDTPNSTQSDNYPPQGNGIGDACECEGNFDCDDDCDGTDAFNFKVDFGRSPFDNPCENGNPCNGDFDCDDDCDGSDAAAFKTDFGRSSFNNPCPTCVVGEWCTYP